MIYEKYEKGNKFKYKLSVLLFTVVIFVSSFLGLFQYIFIRNSMKDNFMQNRKMIRDRLVNIVKDADYINYLLERPLEQDAVQILNKVTELVSSGGKYIFETGAVITWNDSLKQFSRRLRGR